MTHNHGELIRIRGTVQGVGMRPTIVRIARALGLIGDVCNDQEGVLIRAWGTQQKIAALLAQLEHEPPPLARIHAIERAPLSIPSESHCFAIRDNPNGDCTGNHDSQTDSLESDGSKHNHPSRGKATNIAPDAATCPQCLTEIKDPNNRRYRYPFTTCTQCGPRFSIVKALPFERSHTSMADFSQCPECLAEYNDVNDRRYHAQTNACPNCGPQLWLEDNKGNKVTSPTADPISLVAAFIRSGKIVAIKGIGGFHLACDARNKATIQKLRQCKKRPHKAFALMAKNLEMVCQFIKLGPMDEKKLMQNSAVSSYASDVIAPIVVGQRIAVSLHSASLPASQATLATTLSATLPSTLSPTNDPQHDEPEALPDEIAPQLNTLGFMLPYSGLYHLLMDALDSPIVLTSGNQSGEPQCISNETASHQLRDTADYFLFHDRDIVNRCDDSVTLSTALGSVTLRQGRGLAPQHIHLPTKPHQTILAMGAEMKSSFCFCHNNQAILSESLGDLKNTTSAKLIYAQLTYYQQLFAIKPNLIAVDAHPNYLSSQIGRKIATELNIPVIEVLHHHAHVVACMVEHGLSADKRVLGIAMDGIGMGQHNQIWGAEFLNVSYNHFDKLGGFLPVAMPGGNQAVTEPWRNTLAYCLTLGTITELMDEYGRLEILLFLASQPIDILGALIERKLNSPMASSAGRLFDAVAATLGICRNQISYDGQAAIELESLAADYFNAASGTAYPYQYESGVIDWSPMWRQLLTDAQNGLPKGCIAARFHHAIISALTHAACDLCQQENLDTVVLSGGVFQNQLLLRGVHKELSKHQLRVLFNHKIAMNDGGIALGQAAIASHSAPQAFSIP